MGYEIDFMAVGEESSGGDAIALRYGNLHGPRSEQTVIVIDGGYQASGQALVDHIKTRYGTDTVDIVVSTHPDQDHISGLEIVLEQLQVRQLLMHLPWNHSAALSQARAASFHSLSVSEKLEKSLQESSTLEGIANEKGIPIVEPFAGMATADGCFRILGPSIEYYEELLPAISSPPSVGQRLAALLGKAKEAVLHLVEETLHHETLRDDGETRPSNNSSVISLLDVDGHRALLTADAGIPALERALAVLEGEGFAAGDLQFVQVPHHGSRRNVGPTVLDRMLGAKGQTSTRAVAFVSAPAKNPDHKHPAKKVTNAYHRRGYGVHATQGVNKWHHRDAPARADYTASEPIPFHAKVEEDSET
jgi:beta-lactamase superfamily II metal-dependent hydrolase